MNESTTITIDNIVQLIEGIAKAEYQRGYVAGLEEKRLTEKHWGRVDELVDKAVDKKSCNTCGDDYRTCNVYECLVSGRRLHWKPKKDDVEKEDKTKNSEKSCDTCIYWNKALGHCDFTFKCNEYQWYKSMEDKTE